MIVDFSKTDSLVPVIAQDNSSKEVLMLAYMNKEAFDLTVSTGFAHYYSRSRDKIWKKGESSGHVQRVHEIRVDCDNDTVLLVVEQTGGAACHEGYSSCFFRKVDEGKLVIDRQRVFDPENVYNK